MINSLQQELAASGLQLNPDKTKVLTTSLPPTPFFLTTAGGDVEVLRDGMQHKYLGKMLAGSPSERARAAVKGRIAAAWSKWLQHRQTLTNRKVSLKLRLKLFASAVCPVATYSLESSSLTRALEQKLDATQRKMLRNIVGWRRRRDESWNLTMRRMSQRVTRGLQIFPVEGWVCSLRRKKYRLATRIAGSSSSWALRVCTWRPETHRGAVPCRFPGRPPQRWSDDLENFTAHVHGHESWLTSLRATTEDDFISFCD